MIWKPHKEMVRTGDGDGDGRGPLPPLPPPLRTHSCAHTHPHPLSLSSAQFQADERPVCPLLWVNITISGPVHWNETFPPMAVSRHCLCTTGDPVYPQPYVHGPNQHHSRDSCQSTGGWWGLVCPGRETRGCNGHLTLMQLRDIWLLRR